jgi:hypothetical protein
MAAGHSVVVIEAFVVVLTVFCVIVPDSHFGLLVVVLFGVGWMASVDEVTSPWSLAAALALLVFHTALAASSIAAPGARWSPAMRHRWLRRAAVLALLCLASWLVVVAVNAYDLASSSALVAAALAVLAFAGLWARDVTLDAGWLAPRDRGDKAHSR